MSEAQDTAATSRSDDYITGYTHAKNDASLILQLLIQEAHKKMITAGSNREYDAAEIEAELLTKMNSQIQNLQVPLLPEDKNG